MVQLDSALATGPFAEAEVAKEDFLEPELSSALAAEDVLQLYGERFAAAREGEASPAKTGAQILGEAATPGYDVPVELYPYLGLTAEGGEAEKCVGSPAPTATFCYAGSLDKNAPLAMFDIRNEVCLRAGGFKHGQVVRDTMGGELTVVGVKPVDGTPRLWFQPRDLGRPGAGAFPDATAEELRARFSLVAGGAKKELRPLAPEKFEIVEDADGERLCLCRHCRLPLGAAESTSAAPVHAECLAELSLKGLKEETEAKQREAKAAKEARRAEYEIGWRAEHIPRSLQLAKELTGSSDFGLRCLMLDREGVARVVPTVEPAAAVNLEYLALALQVRLLEGREPFFSLDPVDPADRNSMQEKRFEPAWLAGTSVGEVLFQADYHLKELSMGGHEQPVIGMQSCFDISEVDGEFKAWNAREWFVVNKAEVQMSADGALIPSLKMGVEAREQFLGPNGMEDIKVTKADHPLVKYADAFTEKFDLIAERKSVIHQLRELAKASVLAKFLLDSEVQLEEAWFNFEASGKDAYCLEVPQLWNERYSSQLRVQDGKIMDASDVGCKSVRGVYGGVEFGIDKFDLSQPTQNFRLRAAVAPSMPTMGLRLPAPRSVAAPVLETALARAARVVPSARGVPEGAIAVPRFSKRVKGVGAARGVDLNLDQFDLSAPEQVSAEVLGSGPATLGGVFWASLEHEGEAVFGAEDKALLRKVFDPSLSDRRDEGELFVPPNTTPAYVEELRALVKAEEQARQSRKDHFLSAGFVAAAPGPLFPSSWATAEEKPSKMAQVRPRSDYKAAAPVFEKVMKSATPVFDKATEDGVRFRVYRFGSVEVRTTQEPSGEEVIGQVFSACAPKEALVQDGETVAKVVEYVERDAASHRSYAVLEAASGLRVLTEKRADGSVAWEVEPEGLEARNALAKIVRSANCEEAGLSFAALKNFCALQASTEASPAERKHYAQGAFCLASCTEGSGFRQPAQSSKWQLSMEGQGGWRGANAQRLSKQTIRVKCSK